MKAFTIVFVLTVLLYAALARALIKDGAPVQIATESSKSPKPTAIVIDWRKTTVGFSADRPGNMPAASQDRAWLRDEARTYQ